MNEDELLDAELEQDDPEDDDAGVALNLNGTQDVQGGADSQSDDAGEPDDFGGGEVPPPPPANEPPPLRRPMRRPLRYPDFATLAAGRRTGVMTFLGIQLPHR